MFLYMFALLAFAAANTIPGYPDCVVPCVGQIVSENTPCNFNGGADQAFSCACPNSTLIQDAFDCLVKKCSPSDTNTVYSKLGGICQDVNITLPNTFTVPLLSLATSGTFTIGFSTTIMPPLPTTASSSSPTTQTPTATVLSAPPVSTSSGAAGSLTRLDGVMEKVLGVAGSLFVLL